jgi:hypothetical protein
MAQTSYKQLSGTDEQLLADAAAALESYLIYFGMDEEEDVASFAGRIGADVDQIAGRAPLTVATILRVLDALGLEVSDFMEAAHSTSVNLWPQTKTWKIN